MELLSEKHYKEVNDFNDLGSGKYKLCIYTSYGQYIRGNGVRDDKIV